MSLSVWLWTALLSFLPVSELRGGMIYAVINGISPLNAFFIGVIVNILAIFFVFFFLDFLHKGFLKLNLYKKFFDFYIDKNREKIKKLKSQYAVYGFLALTVFVAIPLPATGAWTGCFIAWLLGLDRKESILAITLGVLIAGIIVLLASLGVISFIKLV